MRSPGRNQQAVEQAHLAKNAGKRSNTSVCLKVADAGGDAALPSTIRRPSPSWHPPLEKEGVASDITYYRPNAPPGLRIWCGATVEQREAGESTGTPWLN